MYFIVLSWWCQQIIQCKFTVTGSSFVYCYCEGRSKPPPSQLGSQRNYSRTSSVGIAYQGGNQGGNLSNNAARRMSSAGRLKINELRNKVTELTVQLANVQSENKQLMRQQRQQVTVSYLPYTLNHMPPPWSLHRYTNLAISIYV